MARFKHGRFWVTGSDATFHVSTNSGIGCECEPAIGFEPLLEHGRANGGFQNWHRSGKISPSEPLSIWTADPVKLA
jgi:hypothetical protein